MLPRYMSSDHASGYGLTWELVKVGEHMARTKRGVASSLACVRSMVAAEGPRVLMRGWLPLWARFLPSSVLTFYIYEQFRMLLVGSYMK